SYWKGALALALVGAGVVAAQQLPSSSPPAEPPGRLVTVQEPGKPPQKCRVLSATPLANGGTALRAQSLTTGEISTILEAPGGQPPTSGVRPVAAQKIEIQVEPAPQPPAPTRTAAPAPVPQQPAPARSPYAQASSPPRVTAMPAPGAAGGAGG